MPNAYAQHRNRPCVSRKSSADGVDTLEPGDLTIRSHADHGGFGALVVILVAVIAGAAVQNEKHKSELDQLDIHSRTAIALQATEAQGFIAASTLQRYVYDGDSTFVPGITVAASASQVSLNEAIALGVPGGDQLKVVYAQLIEGALKALALRAAGDAAGALAALNALVPAGHDFALTVETMTAAEMAQVTELRARADRAGDLARWLLVASGASGVVTGLAVSFWVARSIVKPLAQLEVTARRASDGDLSARAPDRGPRELSHLGSVLNEMMSSIERRTNDLSQANHNLTDARAQAATDPLTGLGNHRSFYKRLQDEAVEATGGTQLGLIMMDIDGFKGVNDTFGHVTGDEFLRGVAAALVGVVGNLNSYRYGGDEFAVLLPGAGQLTTTATAESLKGAFLKVDHPTAGRVTASFGVASLPESAATPEELVYRADMAMYLAKSSGKDRVANWGDVTSAAGNPTPADHSGAMAPIRTSLTPAFARREVTNPRRRGGG